MQESKWYMKNKTASNFKPIIQRFILCNQDRLFCLNFLLPEDSISGKTSVTQVIPFQARNYYKSVSENKEVTKLLSVLSSSISSSKKVHGLLILLKFYHSLQFSLHAIAPYSFHKEKFSSQCQYFEF